MHPTSKTSDKAVKTCKTCGKTRFLSAFRKLQSLSCTQTINPLVKKRVGYMVNTCSFCRKKELLGKRAKIIEDAVLRGDINELEARVAIATRRAQKIARAKLRAEEKRNTFLRTFAKTIQRMRDRANKNIRNSRTHWENIETRLRVLQTALKLGRSKYPKHCEGMTEKDVLNFLQEWEKGE